MEKEVYINNISTLALAYLGDAVLEIKVREYTLKTNKIKMHALHRSSVSYVNARSQSMVYDKIQDDLTPEELNILKKGRNAKKNVPKNISVVDYRKSTGLEALLGYLYLLKKNKRIDEIVQRVILIVEGSSDNENRKSSNFNT